MEHIDDDTVLELLHGTIDAARRAEVQSHIDACPECRILVAAVTRSLRADPTNDAKNDTTLIDTDRSTLPRSGAPVASVQSNWPALSPGDLVDRYRLEHALGEGGHGVVWAAVHAVLHKPVALKFLKSRDGDQGVRFLREARIAATLRHPNLVEVFDVLELPDGGLAMVMERLEGESLFERLARPIDATETRRIFAAVVAGVRHAHAKGVVHRDLKPQNVFLADRPKVLDFGLAKLTDVEAIALEGGAATRSGVVMGTPHYMAPEQFAGDKTVDARADVWALGVMLFECLAGRRPFEGAGFGPLFHAVTIGELPRLGLQSPLHAIVDRILVREREARPTLDELERVLNA